MFFLLKKVLKSVVSAIFLVATLFVMYFVLNNVLYIDVGKVINVPPKFEKKSEEIVNKVEQQYEFNNIEDIYKEVESDSKKYIEIK